MNTWGPWLIYIAAVVVLAVSFLGAWMLPVSEFFKGLVSVPGIAALLTFLAQVWRDRLDYERRRALQVNQQDFTRGVASDMAKVAYTKHFEFCQAYCEKLYEGWREMIKLGPTDYAVQLAAELFAIRCKYAVWLSAEIEQQLYPYERALRRLGADVRVMKHTAGRDQSATASEEADQRIIGAFLLLIGDQSPGSDEEAEKSFIAVIENLRKLLGIQGLTALRDQTISAAMTRMHMETSSPHGS
jgi:hypothetical protein